MLRVLRPHALVRGSSQQTWFSRSEPPGFVGVEQHLRPQLPPVRLSKQKGRFLDCSSKSRGRFRVRTRQGLTGRSISERMPQAVHVALLLVELSARFRERRPRGVIAEGGVFWPVACEYSISILPHGRIADGDSDLTGVFLLGDAAVSIAIESVDADRVQLLDEVFSCDSLTS